MFFKANTGSCDGYCCKLGLDADVRRLDVVHTKVLFNGTRYVPPGFSLETTLHVSMKH